MHCGVQKRKERKDFNATLNYKPKKRSIEGWVRKKSYLFSVIIIAIDLFSAQQTHAQWLVSLTSSGSMLLSIDLGNFLIHTFFG